MKILAKNKETGIVQTFDSEAIFKYVAKDFVRVENYVPEIKIDEKTPEPTIILPEPVVTEVITIDEFRQLIDTWTAEELVAFQLDSRQTIQRDAAKELRKRAKINKKV